MVYDIVVVGLGIYGASVAAEAAQRGLRVLAVDKYTPAHHNGSSHGASRIFRLTTVESPNYVPLAQEAYQLWKECDRTLQGKLLVPKGLAIVSQQNAAGQLHHGVTDIIARAKAIAQTYNIEHQLLRGQDMASILPALRVQKDDLVYYEPGAFIIRPEVAVAAAIQRCKANGVTIITGVEATNLRTNSNGMVEVLIGQDKVSTKQLVVCTGPWQHTKLLGENVIPDTNVRPQLVLGMDSAPSTNQPAFVYIGAHQPLLYGVPPGPGLHEMKIGIEQDSVAIPSPDNFADKNTFVTAMAASTTAMARRLLPNIDFTWAKKDVCFYTVTKGSKHQIYRLPHMPQVIVVSACSGHGFKYAPVLAKRIADAVNV